MDRDRSKRRPGPPGATMTGALALLLVICLVECATGSCLSYGHSCWGAHGKRSGKPPVTAPDWFLNKLFRQVDTNANNEMNRARQASKNDDFDAIYQRDTALDPPATDRLGSDNEDIPMEVIVNRNPEAKPMLDDDLLSKIRLWQIMREATLE